MYVCVAVAFQVIGVHARARCWNNARPINAPEDDHLDLERAFDESFAAKLSTSVRADGDPFDIESAFDEAFPLGGSDRDEDASSESTVRVDPSDSERSDEVPGLELGIEDASDDSSVGDGDGGDDDDGAASLDRRHIRKLRRSGMFQREGKHIKLGGKVTGNATGWAGNVSCLTEFSESVGLQRAGTIHRMFYWKIGC